MQSDTSLSSISLLEAKTKNIIATPIHTTLSQILEQSKGHVKDLF